MNNFYLSRYGITDKLIKDPPVEGLEIIITIPAYKEELLIKALESISSCTSPKAGVEVITLINCPEDAPEEVKQQSKNQQRELSALSARWNNINFRIHILHRELPKKHAGVGLARKIIMDEAVRRLEEAGSQDGVIVAFDGDCTCEPNYLLAIEEFFVTNPTANGCSIFFEHLPDQNFSDEIFQAVYDYELHLRCYIDALRWCGLPHAFQTIGSSMAVRSSAYQQQGGMNRRKAGEDFYFLHRIIPQGGFGDLISTTVYPSIRPSDRVPFGTGRAIKKWLESHRQLTYAPSSYLPLKKLTDVALQFYKADQIKTETLENTLGKTLTDFLLQQNIFEELKRINKQSTTKDKFIKHFYQWFNGFMVMKYLHFFRDNYEGMVPVKDGARVIKTWIEESSDDTTDLLKWFRNYDRNFPLYLQKQ